MAIEVRPRPSVAPQYRRRFIAFLDILGFKELTLKADDDEGARDTIRQAIGILQGANNDRRGSGYVFTHFSDSIVLTADVSGTGARAIMESCCRLYLLLLRRGLLLRGGLAVGNVIHQTEGVLYGTGLLEAYNLDERGIPPRIAVTEGAWQALREETSVGFQTRYVTTDEYDLSAIVNVLQDYIRIGRPRDDSTPTKLRIANRIAATISAQAQNTELKPEVRAKWRWLRSYWNSAMARRNRVNQAD